MIDVECFFVTTNTSGQPLVYLSAGTAVGAAIFGISMPGNFLAITGTVTGAGGGPTQVTTGLVSDGLLHHVAARFDLNGGNARVSCMLDGAARVTDATPLSGVSSLLEFTVLAVGQDIQQNDKLAQRHHGARCHQVGHPCRREVHGSLACRDDRLRR